MSPYTEKLWDPLIRLFHWSLVIIFFSNYFFNEKGDDWHQWLGYTAIVWLVVRVFWGFFGTRAARWKDFFPTPGRVAEHVRALFKRRDYHRMGHTPIGGLVMIAMMLCFFGLGVTGYMMTEIDRYWGVEWLETVHGWIANSLLTLVIVHVAAALFESYRLKENLPLSMITGKRKKL